MQLTLAGGKPLLVRQHCVIAAHEATASETHAGGKTKIYLSSGRDMFVQESADDVMFYQGDA